MTEIEAQKFIARWTPNAHRCEATRAKISRIRLQFFMCFISGSVVLLGALFKAVNLHGFWFLRWVGIAFGAVMIVFGVVMMRRIHGVARLLYPPRGPNIGYRRIFKRRSKGVHHRHRHSPPEPVNGKEMSTGVDKTSAIV